MMASRVQVDCLSSSACSASVLPSSSKLSCRNCLVPAYNSISSISKSQVKHFLTGMPVSGLLTGRPNS
jgi:hypothetical protein